jgi:replicative DNA helicase
MKFSLSVLTSSLAAVAASESGLVVTDSSSSSQGMMNIMAHARRLEQNNDQEVDLSWVSGYSLKFQGCHHVQQVSEQIFARA